MHNDNTSIKDESRWTITVVNYLGFCFQPRQEYGNNEDGFQPSPYFIHSFIQLNFCFFNFLLFFILHNNKQPHNISLPP